MSVVALTAGWALHRDKDPAFARAASVAWLVATGLSGWLARLIAYDVLGHCGRVPALAAGVTMAVLGAFLYLVLREGSSRSRCSAASSRSWEHPSVKAATSWSPWHGSSPEASDYSTPPMGAGCGLTTPTTSVRACVPRRAAGRGDGHAVARSAPASDAEARRDRPIREPGGD